VKLLRVLGGSGNSGSLRGDGSALDTSRDILTALPLIGEDELLAEIVTATKESRAQRQADNDAGRVHRFIESDLEMKLIRMVRTMIAKAGAGREVHIR